MNLQRLALAAALACLPLTAQAADAPVTVMIVGDFHMNNPDLDLYDAHADDMLAPKRKMEIKAAADGIARFRPTMVDVEGSALHIAQDYRRYQKGTLPPSRSEVVQLGFRLGKQLDVPVYGIDWMGDFPYQDVVDYAKMFGDQKILDKGNAVMKAETDKDNTILKNGTISEFLRYLNSASSMAVAHGFNRNTLQIGYANIQPGADLLAAWYKRNFYICANLVQLAKPGDRIVVFYGAGHAFLLRQCVSEMPGYKLVEPNDYLPK